MPEATRLLVFLCYTHNTRASDAPIQLWSHDDDEDDDEDDDDDDDHLMKINPLKLLGDESVVEPLQFIRGHIQPPRTYMKREKEKWMGTLHWKQFARTLGDSAGVQSSLPNEMKKRSESGGQVE